MKYGLLSLPIFLFLSSSAFTGECNKEICQKVLNDSTLARHFESLEVPEDVEGKRAYLRKIFRSILENDCPAYEGDCAVAIANLTQSANDPWLGAWQPLVPEVLELTDGLIVHLIDQSDPSIWNRYFGTPREGWKINTQKLLNVFHSVVVRHASWEDSETAQQTINQFKSQLRELLSRSRDDNDRYWASLLLSWYLDDADVLAALKTALAKEDDLSTAASLSESFAKTNNPEYIPDVSQAFERFQEEGNVSPNMQKMLRALKSLCALQNGRPECSRP